MASLFPRYARQALADGPEQLSAKSSVQLLHRICRVYSVVGIAVPVFGVGAAEVMGVMGSAWLIASMALTLDQDAKMASELLRTYRNLVHSLAEKRAKHSADFDTADLCWSTVNAVLNDLAASKPQ
ncbi:MULTISPECIES: hypothetical protein [Streptomyces]|uniref:hypothetical protein n=1 Tax=Streptomyces TaxID=1883 RepID=UPI00225B6D70|nr:hypothetical protein [Streptomyces sp. NBC_00268]MCX5188957.1 hypothetical protein [Streptomyces sp. NBC_00268]